MRLKYFAVPMGFIAWCLVIEVVISNAQEKSEKSLYCRILTCEDDMQHKTIKVKRTGVIEYFEFTPRGFPGLPGRGMAAWEMYYRPGGATKPEAKPVRSEHDEIWIERAYDSRRRVSDVAYVYWKRDHFAVSIVYAAADMAYVPSSILGKGGKPSALEAFLYKLIDNRWFVVDHVSDRVWFDAAVKSLGR